MVPSDLSRAGWFSQSCDPSRSRCMIGAAPHASSEIRGVLIRWSCVLASDLTHIVPSNRAYVASEMTAFLVYWLNSLGCPVFNRPTPRSLCGPGWFPEHWLYYAARSGLRVKSKERSVKLRAIEHSSWPEHTGPCTEVAVVRGNSFGDAHTELMAKACALAAAADVDLVKFRFDGPNPDASFLHADLCPPLEDERIEQAVLGHFV